MDELIQNSYKLINKNINNDPELADYTPKPIMNDLTTENLTNLILINI